MIGFFYNYEILYFNYPGHLLDKEKALLLIVVKLPFRHKVTSVLSE